MTIDETLLLIAPELADIDSAVRNAMIELAALSVGASFGDKRDLATAYLTAHMFTVRGRNGVTGAVKSVKEGDLAVTYADSGTTGDYSSTSYGLEYQRLSRSSILSARTRAV